VTPSSLQQKLLLLLLVALQEGLGAGLLLLDVAAVRMTHTASTSASPSLMLAHLLLPRLLVLLRDQGLLLRLIRPLLLLLVLRV
jgi:hypothetical protein